MLLGWVIRPCLLRRTDAVAPGLTVLLLGGSWVVISGVISPLIGVISVVTLLITLLATTHEPPSGSHSIGDCLMPMLGISHLQALSPKPRRLQHLRPEWRAYFHFGEST